MIVSFAGLFAAGILTMLSPCVLRHVARLPPPDARC
jgi:cytochrome c biogenesis protein CcdA